jgi:hypothetical protein
LPPDEESGPGFLRPHPIFATEPEAEQSNDPDRMRDALGQARKSLSKMKNRMDMCMNMMDMMEKMHGKGRKKR